MGPVVYLVIAALVIFTTLIVILSRYKKCPSDRIMVIYGKVGSNPDGSNRSAKCIHGGAAFIWPIFQSYEYLDLTPISIPVDLTNALSRQNIRIDVPSRFTVGISTEPGVMQNAAERLLGLKLNEIQELAKDIIFGQLRLVIATMDIEEINTDRDKFLEAVSGNVETELKKIGLRLINVNVTDISDESGYIIARGKEAAAKAINDAKISVAEADRAGAIGEANANRDKRIQVSVADSEAIQGENNAKALIADSDATRREREADAQRRAVSAENSSGESPAGCVRRRAGRRACPRRQRKSHSRGRHPRQSGNRKAAERDYRRGGSRTAAPESARRGRRHLREDGGRRPRPAGNVNQAGGRSCRGGQGRRRKRQRRIRLMVADKLEE